MSNNDEIHLRQAKLVDTLRCLAKELSNKNDYDQCVKNLSEIYAPLPSGGGSFRHSYANATSVIYDIAGGTDDDVDIQNIGDNLRTICDDTDTHIEKHVRDSLNKLLDHVNLEIVRMSYMMENFQATNGNADERNANEAAFSILKERFEKTETDLADMREKMNNQQRDYVAILGVFATIAVAFASGIGASFSILKGTSSADTLLLSVASVGILLMSSIYCLVACIKSITDKERTAAWQSLLPFVLFVALFSLLFLAKNKLCT